jgi:DNA-directed RNA polymerase subunit M/transcription elongation factor TFIIS
MAAALSQDQATWIKTEIACPFCDSNEDHWYSVRNSSQGEGEVHRCSTCGHEWVISANDA